MNLNIAKLMVVSGCLALAVSGRAETLDFSFSVTNTVGTTPGSFSGVIYGLADNSTGSAADVVITSFPAALNSAVGSAPIDAFSTGWSVQNNSFTVTGGQITAAGFFADAGSGYIYLDLGSSFNALELDDTYYTAYIQGSSGIAYDNFNSYATPEPTILALAGLGGAVLLLRKRK